VVLFFLISSPGTGSVGVISSTVDIAGAAVDIAAAA